MQCPGAQRLPFLLSFHVRPHTMLQHDRPYCILLIQNLSVLLHLGAYCWLVNYTLYTNNSPVNTPPFFCDRLRLISPLGHRCRTLKKSLKYFGIGMLKMRALCKDRLSYIQFDLLTTEKKSHLYLINSNT